MNITQLVFKLMVSLRQFFYLFCKKLYLLLIEFFVRVGDRWLNWRRSHFGGRFIVRLFCLVISRYIFLKEVVVESFPEDGDHLEFSKPFAVVLNDKKVECTGIARTGDTAVLLPTVGYRPRPSIEEMLQDKMGIDICTLPTEHRAALCNFIKLELSRQENASKQNIQNESQSEKPVFTKEQQAYINNLIKD